jgi:hypothetical protein
MRLNRGGNRRLNRALYAIALSQAWHHGPAKAYVARKRASGKIALLTLAAKATDRAVDRIAAGRLVGRSESDVAREIQALLVGEGCDAAVFATVASGLNSASPHHEGDERLICPGEPVVFDVGGLLV